MRLRPRNPMGMFTYVTLCVWFPGMGWTTMSGPTSGPRSPCPPWAAPPSVDPPGRTGLHPLQRRYVMYKASSCASSYSIFFWGGVHVTMCSVLGCTFCAFVILYYLITESGNE